MRKTSLLILLLAFFSLPAYAQAQILVPGGGGDCSTAGVACLSNVIGSTVAGISGTPTTSVVFSGAPSLTTPTFAGAPTSNGSVGRDATTGALTIWESGTSGWINRTIAAFVINEALTNTVTSAQLFGPVWTIPANYLTAGKTLRVSINLDYSFGVSSAALILGLSLGGTSVYATPAGQNPGDSVRRAVTQEFIIVGTGAPGASVSVFTGGPGASLIGASSSNQNNVVQPVALATNGALAIQYSVQWSATGSTEWVRVYSAYIEALN